MSVMLASDILVVDTLVNRVVQDGDTVYRTGVIGAVGTFQGVRDWFLVTVDGREVAAAEYGLSVTAMCVCLCAFVSKDGEVSVSPNPACQIPAEDH